MSLASPDLQDMRLEEASSETISVLAPRPLQLIESGLKG
jgi:hypothetical protein